jgi:hypothetical protein
MLINQELSSAIFVELLLMALSMMNRICTIFVRKVIDLTIRIIESHGDWAGIYDLETGELITEGHITDMYERALYHLGIKVTQVPWDILSEEYTWPTGSQRVRRRCKKSSVDVIDALKKYFEELP